MNIKKGFIFRCNRSKTRFVEVLEGPNKEGRVTIITRYTSLQEGSAPVGVIGMQPTTALAERFDSRSNGYTFCAESIYMFSRKKMHLLGFAQKARTTNRNVAKATGDLSTGEFWQELTDRHLRIVEIIGENESGQKEIITRFFTKNRGETMVEMGVAIPTFAKADRFNGRSSGYAFVGKTRRDVLNSGKMQERYVPRMDAMVLDKIVAKFGQPVSKGQLWHDLSSARIRLVEVSEVQGRLVELKTTYEQDEVSGHPQRVVWDQGHKVPMEEFLSENPRFNLVKAVPDDQVTKLKAIKAVA